MPLLRTSSFERDRAEGRPDGSGQLEDAATIAHEERGPCGSWSRTVLGIAKCEAQCYEMMRTFVACGLLFLPVPASNETA